MIVFVAGMPRSGSTFTFNIVRGLLEQRGSLHQTPVESVLTALESTGSADNLIFKGHAADEVTIKLVKLGAVKTVCSFRKPEDAIASWMDTFNFSLEASLCAMDCWLRMFREVRDYALIVPFDTIDNDPFTAARSIAQHVCPGSDPKEADAICRSFTKDRVQRLSQELVRGDPAIEDIGFSYYDKATFFHRRHVASLEVTKANARIRT